MAFKTVFIFILSSCLSSLVFASQSPSSAEDQFKLAMKSDSTSPEETRYWLEQSASQGYLPAQKQLAEDYTLGLTGSVSYPQAAYWLSSIALSDPADSGYALASFLEKHQQNITTDDLIEAWYQLSAKQNKDAEIAYNHFLEQRFNQLRAKQVSAMTELDQSSAEAQPMQSDDINQAKGFSAEPFLAIGFCGLMLSAGWFGYRKQQQKRKLQSVDEENRTRQLDVQVKELEFTNKQLKRQLEQVFREFKKVKSESAPHDLTIACAVFGYTPNSIPQAQAVKLRYRQLSKLYHPDAQGSEAEMKRLNQAFRTITQNVTKA
ncbi:J domain-containing protein [Vibrio natriegens]|uniref:J domain-containing protein n=1 Tax=Vibrio natriegens TaxID=691 RepID=UPI002E34DD9C|nr:J domain-containing protein [Vibrio natriegens]